METKYLENVKFFAHLEVHWTIENEKALIFQKGGKREYCREMVVLQRNIFMKNELMMKKQIKERKGQVL